MLFIENLKASLGLGMPYLGIAILFSLLKLFIVLGEKLISEGTFLKSMISSPLFMFRIPWLDIRNRFL
jgi:hypothetical protein